jgi:hypothetical protein
MKSAMKLVGDLSGGAVALATATAGVAITSFVLLLAV